MIDVRPQRTLGLGGLLLELLLPTVFSASVLLAGAGWAPSWNLRTKLGLGIFGVLLVLLSAVASLRLDTFTRAGRRERGRAQILNRATYRNRVFKLAIGGLAIPALAFAAATRLQLPNHRTPLDQAVRWRLQTPGGIHASRIGDAALHAHGPDARLAGILALQALGSDEALGQLVRFLSEDPALLKDPAEAQALTKALASYGARAKGALLRRLAQAASAPGGEVEAAPGDLFDRQFAPGFDAVKDEIAGTKPDTPERARALERLQAARSELEQALRKIEADTPPEPGASTVPSLILRAFLQMDVKHDAEVLEVARRIAADARWPSIVRGEAIQLIAKLGDADSLEELLGYVDGPDPRLQARALQAIATLQLKTVASSGR